MRLLTSYIRSFINESINNKIIKEQYQIENLENLIRLLEEDVKTKGHLTRFKVLSILKELTYGFSKNLSYVIEDLEDNEKRLVMNMKTNISDFWRVLGQEESRFKTISKSGEKYEIDLKSDKRIKLLSEELILIFWQLKDLIQNLAYNSSDIQKGGNQKRSVLKQVETIVDKFFKSLLILNDIKGFNLQLLSLHIRSMMNEIKSLKGN
jgi:hypothetical protein